MLADVAFTKQSNYFTLKISSGKTCDTFWIKRDIATTKREGKLKEFYLSKEDSGKIQGFYIIYSVQYGKGLD